ncbi:Tocopherol O-methyltransferase, chloroplastic, partial [Tetrabaena socialis]
AARANALSAAQGLGERLTFQVADALAQPFEAGAFDLVWSMESGEHMPDKQQFVRELARVCAPGGVVIVVTWCHRVLAAGEAGLRPDEAALLDRICEAYYLPAWCSVADYERLFDQTVTKPAQRLAPTVRRLAVTSTSRRRYQPHHNDSATSDSLIEVMMKDLKAGIANFYDESSELWESMWGEHMHHGYYPKGAVTKGHQQAQLDMIEETLRVAGVTQVSNMVDVGCGIGGSSRYIAKKYGCRSSGITLSPKQAEGLTDIRTRDWSEEVSPFWGAVIATALTGQGLAGLARAGWTTIKGALVMPLMAEGFRRGLIKFNVITARRSS